MIQARVCCEAEEADSDEGAAFRAKRAVAFRPDGTLDHQSFLRVLRPNTRSKRGESYARQTLRL